IAVCFDQGREGVPGFGADLPQGNDSAQTSALVNRCFAKAWRDLDPLLDVCCGAFFPQRFDQGGHRILRPPTYPAGDFDNSWAEWFLLERFDQDWHSLLGGRSQPSQELDNFAANPQALIAERLAQGSNGLLVFGLEQAPPKHPGRLEANILVRV